LCQLRIQPALLSHLPAILCSVVCGSYVCRRTCMPPFVDSHTWVMYACFSRRTKTRYCSLQIFLPLGAPFPSLSSAYWNILPTLRTTLNEGQVLVHEIVRAFETHPKINTMGIEIIFSVLMGLQVKCKDICDWLLTECYFISPSIHVDPSTN
jgi:hypothetical protein